MQWEGDAGTEPSWLLTPSTGLELMAPSSPVVCKLLSHMEAFKPSKELLGSSLHLLSQIINHRSHRSSQIVSDKGFVILQSLLSGSSPAVLGDSVVSPARL